MAGRQEIHTEIVGQHDEIVKVGHTVEIEVASVPAASHVEVVGQRRKVLKVHDSVEVAVAGTRAEGRRSRQ